EIPTSCNGCSPPRASAMTSSACSPMEPVEPRTRMRRVIGSECSGEEAPDVHHGDGHHEGVDAVEHAAMLAEHRARILDVGTALEQRFEQVAHRRDERHG